MSAMKAKEWIENRLQQDPHAGYTVWSFRRFDGALVGQSVLQGLS
jgi:hypothetical protein